MKTILITAYAVNPYKGSEDAMGWNMLMQACRYNNVVAVTRKNNRPFIESYIKEHPEMNETHSHLAFLYFDWPQWMIGWKKGPLLSMIYYYFWQFSVAVWLRKQRRMQHIDIVHNLNFHNDWTPTFLWMLGKPLVWGHVGHHPKIPRKYILPVYGKREYVKDRLLWLIKQAFWRFDPFLFIGKKKAARIICMNDDAVKKLRVKDHFIVHPSVAAWHSSAVSAPPTGVFNILSVGRFVPLKGFDLTIKAFSVFYHALPEMNRGGVRLTLVGKGPFKSFIEKMIEAEGMQEAVELADWVAKEEMGDKYAAASVFLFPSHEGAGMVVPEAMSAGLPVLCLDNDGPGRLIHPQSSLRVGYGAYTETIELLAVTLMKLYLLPDLMQRERQLAKERFDTLLNWNVRGEMLRSVYDDLVQDRLPDLTTP